MAVALPLLLSLAHPASGQEMEPLALEVSPRSGQLMLHLGDLLADASVVDALHSGLPVRVRVVAELWKDRLFDGEEERAEWRATVVYEPLERTYRVQTSSADDHERIVSSLEEAGEILSRRVMVPLRPAEPGRYYYIANLEAGTLSLSDLEELARWLRGDLAPAGAGEERMEGALGRGVNRLLVRVLNMPARRFRARTPTFEVGDAPADERRRPHEADTARAEESPAHCGNSARLTRSDSIMSTSGSTAIPAPAGMDSVPSCSTNSGLTMSRSQ